MAFVFSISPLKSALVLWRLHNAQRCFFSDLTIPVSMQVAKRFKTYTYECLTLSAPSQPKDVSVSCGELKDTATISWKEPTLTYGLTVNYTVEYWRFESPTRKFYIQTGRGKSATISVESERLYIFQVHFVVARKDSHSVSRQWMSLLFSDSVLRQDPH